MGDAVTNRRRAFWQRSAAPALILALVVASGCSSSRAPRAAKTAPAPQASTAAPAATPQPAAPPPIQIESMELREGAPGVLVDLDASGPMVWTSYRDASGDLVIELPNSVPGPKLNDLEPEEGLVASIKVSKEENAARPLTRLTVHTRQDVEHSLAADGKVLQLRLLPVETERPAAVALTYEPLPEDETAGKTGAPAPSAPAPSPATTAAGAPVPPAPSVAAADLGTPQHPAVAPAPTGPVASRLKAVEASSVDGGTVVKVEGDGEFRYSTFKLEDPARFVIDLTGVVNTSPRSTVPVGGDVVERVRVAQFKPVPEPVSRVVFDLKESVPPQIERTADGLVVRFGGTVAASAPPAAAATTMAQDMGAEPHPPTAAPAGPAPAQIEAQEQQTSIPEPTTAAAEAATPSPAEAQAEAQQGIEVEPEKPAVESAEEAASPAAPAPAQQPATAAAVAATPPSPAAPARAAKSALPTSDVSLFEAADVNAGAPAGQKEETVTPVFGQQVIGEKKYLGEPINMSLRDADVVETLRSFASISGLNIVVQPGVKGTVTVELNQVPWNQALEEILKINGLGYELDGNIMRIAPIQQLRAEAEEQQKLAAAKALSVPLRTVMKRLSYATARDVAAVLRGSGAGARGGAILSQRGSVIVDRRTNTLVIKELPAYMDTVIAVIENLDTPEPQVMIEARIVETTKRFTRSLGVQWSFSQAADAIHGNTTGLVFPSQVNSSGGVNLITGGNSGFLNLTLGNLTNSFQLDAALQAAETEGLINILSAPKVATLNNEQASVQSGLQIPIQTIANNTVTVQFINATLRLEVTPHITAEGTVMMEINVQKKEPQLAFALGNARNAPIDTKEAQTRVAVRDGGTAVIGGIYEVSTDQGEDRVPGLANIPIIGRLFRNQRRTDENKELLIFITPRVVKL
jgi:type IV pilus assembly protein PilQ